MSEENNLYNYKAKITRVIDGDSVVASIDLGMDTWLHNQRLRLAGINTPEIRGDERDAGLVAKDWLVERIENKEVTINTGKDIKGRYGRWVARIYIDDECVNDELLSKGMASVPSYL